MANASSDRYLHERLKNGLKADIDRSINTLLAAPADKHDRLCGRISGLQAAITLIDDAVRKWNLERDAE